MSESTRDGKSAGENFWSSWNKGLIEKELDFRSYNEIWSIKIWGDFGLFDF